MDLSLSESERDLVDLCRTFAQKEIAPRAPLAWDEARCPTDLLREMGGLGLLGILVPRGVGRHRHVSDRSASVCRHGADRPRRPVRCRLGLAGPRHHRLAPALSCSGTTTSASAGSARWPRGEVLGAFGLTEPVLDAGSDARGIRTRAERRDGGWLINGRGHSSPTPARTCRSG